MNLQVGTRQIPPGRVFCIGMNYVEHIHELKNELPEAPVIFMKPTSSLVPPGGEVIKPTHGNALHYETEVVVLIGQKGRPRTPDEARSFIGGLSLGMDMTLRDVQTTLRAKANPWELSKSFETSAPVGNFTPVSPELDLASLEFTGLVNGIVRQKGNTADMVFPIPRLILAVAQVWTLLPGDLIYTGTPVGIGPVIPGDRMTATAPWCGQFEWTVR